MTSKIVFNIFLSIITGYLIGAFLPGYFLPLWIKKIDIRQVGDGNPGVLNVKRNTNIYLALLTAIYDIFKGVIAICFVLFVFRLSFVFAYISGFSAILGLKFPFYLGFKGGKGFAATIGLLAFVLTKIFIQDLSLAQTIPFFIYLVFYTLFMNLSIHQKGDFFTITLFPIIGLFLLLNLRSYPDLIFALALISIMTIEAGRNLLRENFILSNEKETVWRTIARPFALLFILIGITTSQEVLIILIGGLFAISFLFDLVRIVRVKKNNFSLRLIPHWTVFKGEENERISSITGFLLGIFLCLILFDKEIAFASLGYVTIGDLFGKLVGINYGRIKIFSKSKKTLEGSLAFLGAAVTVSYFLWFSGWLSLSTAIIGALAATIIEAVPIQIDDNLTVSVLSAAIMRWVQ